MTTTDDDFGNFLAQQILEAYGFAGPDSTAEDRHLWQVVNEVMSMTDAIRAQGEADMLARVRAVQAYVTKQFSEDLPEGVELTWVTE